MVSVVEKTCLNHRLLNPMQSQVGQNLRKQRCRCRQTQDFLAKGCQRYGTPITRDMLAHYECGNADVPARYIPIIAHVLGVAITDLLPPINDEAIPNGKLNHRPRSLPRARSSPANQGKTSKAKNIAGQKIRRFRAQRRWTQAKLASMLRKLGIHITRNMIANVETQRRSVTDWQLAGFAKALQIPLQLLLR
jgi:transcriptional regulator with XRE-family HTH domain